MTDKEFMVAGICIVAILFVLAAILDEIFLYRGRK